jgi:hypothetical protein
MIVPLADHEVSGALQADERVCEVLFGLIMTLTITGSISVAEAGRGEVRTILIAAVGCNLAWGIIDAIMYLMGCLSQRGRSLRLLAQLHHGSSTEGCEALRRSMPEVVQQAIGVEHMESLRLHLLERPPLHDRPRLEANDYRAALGVLLWVCGAAVPVVLPFALVGDLPRAMAISRVLAVAMLFVAGSYYGWSSGLRPLATGLLMVLIGTVLVAITAALGG